MDNTSNKKNYLKDMEKLARKRHASFYKLNKDFINENDLLYWTCVNGHSFHFTPKDINNSKWCESCPEIIYVDGEELPVLIEDKYLTYKKHMSYDENINLNSNKSIWPIHEQFYNHYKYNCDGGMSRPIIALPFREINIDFKLK